MASFKMRRSQSQPLAGGDLYLREFDCRCCIVLCMGMSLMVCWGGSGLLLLKLELRLLCWGVAASVLLQACRRGPQAANVCCLR